jgi:hypothetical protein
MLKDLYEFQRFAEYFNEVNHSTGLRESRACDSDRRSVAWRAYASQKAGWHTFDIIADQQVCVNSLVLSSCRLILSFIHLFVLIVLSSHPVFSHQLMKLGQWRYVGLGPKEPIEPMMGNWLL